MKQKQMAVCILVCLNVVFLVLVAVSPLSAQEPTLRATLKGHTEPVTGVAFSPDGKTLASGSRLQGLDEGQVRRAR